MDSDITAIIQEDIYVSRGIGFRLQSIDGLLLGMYTYTPMSASSYIELPLCIANRHATINPQNSDQQCFKWAILARHVMEHTKYRIGENYRKHEGKYNFEGISFPTPLSDITKFEKNSTNVSINIYSQEKKLQPPRKYPAYEVFPIKVVNNEKSNHFDLLLLTDEGSSLYTSLIFHGLLGRKKLNIIITAVITIVTILLLLL